MLRYIVIFLFSLIVLGGCIFDDFSILETPSDGVVFTSVSLDKSKKTYIEYLKWQKNASRLMLEKVEEIFVKSKGLDIEQKKIKFKKAIQELFSTEKVLKSKLEKLKITIYEELNKK